MTTTPPTVVLLPGMHGTAELFDRFISAIPQSIPYRALDYPPDQILSFEEIFQIVKSSTADLSDMIVIGESYSGALAVRLGAEFPDRVRCVVMSAGFVLPPLPRVMKAIVHPLLFRLPMPAFAIRYLVAGPDASDEFVIQVRNAIRRPARPVLTQRARDVLDLNYADALRDCRPPVMYIAPSNDHMVRSSSLRSTLAIRSDIQVCTIDGPHLILQSAPQACWRAISKLAGI